MKRVCVYNRCSTEEQAKHGYSLEAMLERCRHYVFSQEDAILIKVYEDKGYSGTLSPTRRPALNELLETVRRGDEEFDALLVWKLDRLSRSMRDTLNIEYILRRANKSLESVSERLDTSTAAGRMFFNTIASFAEFESAQIGERTWNTMSSQISKKKFMGGKPAMGYRLNGNIFEIDEKGAEIVRLIFQKYLKLKCYNRVAKVLNERKIGAPKGGLWTHVQIKKLVTNPVYTGDLVWNRTNRRARIVNPADRWVILKDAHSQIIPKRLFERVQQLQG